jgi:hypothetical protein
MPLEMPGPKWDAIRRANRGAKIKCPNYAACGKWWQVIDVRRSQ